MPDFEIFRICLLSAFFFPLPSSLFLGYFLCLLGTYVKLILKLIWCFLFIHLARFHFYNVRAVNRGNQKPSRGWSVTDQLF